MSNDGRVVTVRLSGDDLDPLEVSEALGAHPMAAWKKGESMQLPDGSVEAAGTGTWVLGVDGPRRDLDGQIVELLSRMTKDPEVWRALGVRHRCELVCGVFMAELTERLSIQKDTLAMIAARGLPLTFDVYGAVRA